MIGLAIFMGAFALAFLLFGLADQRKIYWRFQARQFRNPEANEPSDAAYTGRRVLLLGVALAAAVMSVNLFRTAGAFDFAPDHDEILEQVRSAAEDLEESGAKYRFPGPEEDGSWGEYINAELKGPGDDLLASFQSADGAVERYEISDVCLTVTATPVAGQAEPSDPVLDTRSYRLKTEVTDRACE
ncbi:hypothetical protein [Streptomyces sp. NPDC051776]|uniref:hypothetical protein n=1 Tax=Streptomyces sp. NPDC051776 TaxID=3155414 RepID=UPI0034262AAE